MNILVNMTALMLMHPLLVVETLWTEKRIQFTGFELSDLQQCILHIHEKW